MSDDPDPPPLQFGLAISWRQWFRARMVEGLEPCRGWCGREGLRPRAIQKGGLGFGHILAKALGGGLEPGNMTIVCTPCDVRMGPGDWRGVFAPIVTEPVWQEFLAANRRVHEEGDTSGDRRRQRRRELRRAAPALPRPDWLDRELAALQAGYEARALDDALDRARGVS